jgi:hypothetical protein
VPWGNPLGLTTPVRYRDHETASANPQLMMREPVNEQSFSPQIVIGCPTDPREPLPWDQALKRMTYQSTGRWPAMTVMGDDAVKSTFRRQRDRTAEYSCGGGFSLREVQGAIQIATGRKGLG